MTGGVEVGMGGKVILETEKRSGLLKGSDLFLKGGRTKKQVAGRGTSRYSIGIKS